MADGDESAWEDWCLELERIAGDHYGPLGPLAECGELGWRAYFEDGFSPHAAFMDDLLHTSGEEEQDC